MVLVSFLFLRFAEKLEHFSSLVQDASKFESSDTESCASANSYSRIRIALDVRDSSWFCDEVWEFLRARNWAYVIHQHPTLETKLVVCPFVIVYRSRAIQTFYVWTFESN
jgi:lipid A disaccharide synthetase